MSLSSNLRVEPRKQKTDYNLFQALRTSAKNFQPNLHFWQIVPSPTNFPFSTGLTKSTRLLGKHERVHEMASRSNLTKKRNFRCNSFFLQPWALRPYLCLWRWWDLVAGRLVGSKHNLQDFWPPGSPFRPNEGSADDLWDSRTYPSIQVCRKLDHGKFNNALRHSLLTPVGSNMGQEV